MSYLPASVTNLLATLEPAMTAAEAYVFLHERMTLIQIAGSLVILSAVLIVQFQKE
jgi:drug/metabolite transporter (DMT)-like permease